MGRSHSTKPTRCLACGGTEFAVIVYGLVRGPAVREDVQSGKVVLGGCMVTGNDPKWHCNTCGKRFPEDAEEHRNRRLR